LSMTVSDEGGSSLFIIRILWAVGKRKRVTGHGHGNDAPNATCSSDAAQDYTIGPTTGVMTARRRLQRLQPVHLQRPTGVMFPTREGSVEPWIAFLDGSATAAVSCDPADSCNARGQVIPRAWGREQCAANHSNDAPGSPTLHSAMTHTPTPAPTSMAVPTTKRATCDVTCDTSCDPARDANPRRNPRRLPQRLPRHLV
jgi:hypothetical protein